MKIVAVLSLLILAACGGGGSPAPEPTIPDGIPVIVNGFVNWTDVQTTPDGSIGVVNGQGQSLVSVEFTDADGTDQFDVNIAPGALWASGSGILPGFYLVTAIGADGRVFRRYFRYDPAIGWDAAVVSVGNWDLDF